MGLQRRLGSVSCGIAVVALVAAGGCRPPADSQQAPSPIGYSGAIGEGYVVWYQWPGGPAVMMCCDFKPDRTESKEEGGGPPWHRTMSGIVSESSGKRMEWLIETKGSEIAKFEINGARYDLGEGGLFLLRASETGVRVEQLQQKLPPAPPSKESCEKFAAENAEVGKLLGLVGM